MGRKKALKELRAYEMKSIIDFVRSFNRPVSAVEVWKEFEPKFQTNHMTFFRRLRMMKKLGLIGLVEKRGFILYDPERYSSHAREQGEAKGEPSSPDGEREEPSETNSGPKG